ncbi:MAG: hypothetical protein LBC94_06445 [Desulfovibrio sp.]|nr:hypothetical protein [Desulfovibrio sp.]
MEEIKSLSGVCNPLRAPVSRRLKIVMPAQYGFYPLRRVRFRQQREKTSFAACGRH